MKRHVDFITGLLAVLMFSVLSFGQEPAVTISKGAHPNLAGAQQHLVEANRLIVIAQKENKYDMQGHAQKARDLLLQADNELKAAAKDADAANAANKKKAEEAKEKKH
jgi:hypothetical protein